MILKIFLSALFLFSCSSLTRDKELTLTPAQRDSLKIKSTEARMEIGELSEIESIAKELVQQHSIEEGEISRLFSYLRNAQKVFADESYLITANFSGSLRPISMQILQLFFPDYKNEDVSDPFSEELAVLVIKKFAARFKEEQSHIHPVSIQKKEGYWFEPNPVGITIPTMQPWALTRPSEFRRSKPPAPESKFWQEQAALVKKAVEEATEEQKKQVLFWAGKLPDSKNWNTLADEYMTQHETPFAKQLEVQAKLATAMFDTLVATFDTKYVYLVRRPNMVDPSLETTLPTPNHPSYPAAHTATGTAAAHILSYYFPENRQEWLKLIEEERMSRIRGGFHFPIDNMAGKSLGIEVANAVLSRKYL